MSRNRRLWLRRLPVSMTPSKRHRPHPSSLQTKPFLHVDGDVYVPHSFSDEIEGASLVAQNREIGASYYKDMMDRIMNHPAIHIPGYIKRRLNENSIASYNMGIFGGRNLHFIRDYCNEVFRFMSGNKMNDPECAHSNVWCNIFFEQMIFAAKADEEGCKVTSILGRPMKDEGYTNDEFCDLRRYEEKQFFHLLGGHKGNRQNCEMLMKTLLRLYPETFRRILSLFPRRHLRQSGLMGKSHSILSIQMCMAQYKDFLEELEQSWSYIPLEQMECMKTQEANYVRFIAASEVERRTFIIHANPRIKMFNVPATWHEMARQLLRDRLTCENNFPMEHIAVIPSLMGRGLKEVPIVDIQMEVLEMLDMHGGEMTWGELHDLLVKRFMPKAASPQKGTDLFIENENVYLMHHGLLLVRTSDS